LLRGASSPLADSGFSARVLAALPMKARADRSRFWWCLAGTLAGVVFALLRGVSLAGLEASALEFGRDLEALRAVAANPSFALALVIAALSLGYAFWPAGRKALSL